MTYIRICKTILHFRIIFLIVALVFIHSVNIFAQDKVPVTFGKVGVEDFSINSPLIDSGTNAIVIADVATTNFEGNKKGWFSYVFKRQKRIKILDKRSFDLATVKIELYHSDNGDEKAEKITGSVYNLENGKSVETKLSSKDIFEVKEDKNYTIKKFTLPGVKEGAIIEYSYTVISDFEFNLPAWSFQSETCPVLWSEYNVTIPGLLSYMTFFQGYHKFAINNGSDGFQRYLLRQPSQSGIADFGNDKMFTVSAPTTIHRWVMKDLPAFKVENYISSPENFIDKITFQLYKTYDGENFHDVVNNWKKLTDELMIRTDFGQPLTEDNTWLDDILSKLVQSGDDRLQIAKKIYYYVQDNFTCTDHHDKYIKTSLRDVVKKKGGNIGEINLLLTAMLKRKNMEAFPVLLSTRDFGRGLKDYPRMERLNYVICTVKINSEDYFLDATTPFLPFGKLPEQCYNGSAHVISNDTTAVYFEPDEVKEKSSINVFIINNDKKEVEGSYTNNLGFFKSLETKTLIAKTSLNSFKSDYSTSLSGDMQVNNIKIDSFQSAEDPVSIKFDFAVNSFENSDIVYFNPFIAEGIKQNPFFATERMYPVEMPYTVDELYVLNMEIPDGYRLEELPKSARIELNETEGMFEYLIKADNGTIQMKCRLLLNKANFNNNDYKGLRDFYGDIVKKEAEQIVFKKIK